MTTPNRVRLAVLVTPKAGLSTEEFHDYWLNHHAKVFSSTAIAKKNVLKYEQMHIDPKHLEPLLGKVPGYTPPPYRGLAIFEAESLDKIFELFVDEEYLRDVVPDEERFLARDERLIFVGPVAELISRLA